MPATRITDRRKKPVRLGPYARRTSAKPAGELTEEGRRVLAEWMERWPHPEALLSKFHRSLYLTAAIKLGPDDLRGACYAGLTRAMLSFDPEKAVFSTYASHFLRSYVQVTLARLDRPERYGLRVEEGHSHLGDDGGTLLDLVQDRGDTEPDDALQCAELRAMIAAILRDRVKNYRHREIFVLRHGLHGGEPLGLREVAAVFGISKERVRQLVHIVEGQIRNELRALWEA